MATVSRQKMADDKVEAATGRVWSDWYGLLDAQNATTWSHPKIAKWLSDTHDVDGWWAQAVTVGYEQERGLRQPGQRADGTFAVTATKTIAAARAEVVESVLAALVGQLGEASSQRLESQHSTARWAIDGETVIAGISEPKPGKTLIALERSKLSSADELEPAKTKLRQVLAAVTDAVV